MVEAGGLQEKYLLPRFCGLSPFKLGLYLMMLDPSVKFNMKLMHQELSTRNQKCDALDDDAMIPMCRPCFAGDLKMKAPES